MAATFKIIVFVIMCLSCIHRIDCNKWFSKYEEVTALFIDKDAITDTLKMDSKVASANLVFNTIEKHFSFQLKREHFPNGDKNMVISVDYGLQSVRDIAEQIRLYRGVMNLPCCRYTTIVKITSEGLDAIIMLGNETFYLEPISRYGLQFRQKRYNNTNDINFKFQCIFYKPSAVSSKFIGLNISWEGIALQKSFDTRNNLPVKQKRSTRTSAQTECTLHLVADHLFYQTAGKSNILNTISEMSYLVLQANLIFRAIDFDGDGASDNIGFYVTKMSVYTEPDSYTMARADSMHSYLEIFSENNFNGYCLATAFTGRAFEGNTIGIAWMASSNILHNGGICQTKNTNIVTNINAGVRMPTYITALVLVHEFGHSFGSLHDNKNDVFCTPAGFYGNYLMYPYVSDGGRQNNDEFSPCSINYMYPVVRNKGSCLKESVSSFCGNSLREEEEECDCGTMATCAAVDHCCTPSDISDSDPDQPCTFRRSQGSMCSPILSHCCADDCKTVLAILNNVCKAKSECKQQSVCDGIATDCPPASIIPDTTLCAGGIRSCKDGLCIGSVCATVGLTPCTCSGGNECYICCLNLLSQCAPFMNDKEEKLGFTEGATCNERQGFCNSEGKCISTDQASTIDRLSNIFTDEAADNAKKWLIAQWYYVVLGVLAFIFLIFLFARTCRNDNYIQTSAYMHGRFTGIKQEAELYKAYLERQRNKAKARYRKQMHNIEMDFPIAVARMMVFFPTISINVIVQTLKSSATEESAIRWHIFKNHPFRCVSKEL